MSTPVVTVHTDGACSGNPGPGGWSAILTCGEHRKELSDGEPETTNNRMELTAVLKGLHALTRPCQATIVTDSANVIGWLSQGWKRKNVQIAALCAEIERLIEAKGLTVEFQKVAGHTGHPLNERADQLAVAAIPR